MSKTAKAPIRTKALAAVVAIMDETAMRIGNEDSARDAKTYGASTLKVKHLTFSGSKAKIKYGNDTATT